MPHSGTRISAPRHGTQLLIMRRLGEESCDISPGEERDYMLALILLSNFAGNAVILSARNLAAII